jgi:hypothetical protein
MEERVYQFNSSVLFFSPSASGLFHFSLQFILLLLFQVLL